MVVTGPPTDRAGRPGRGACGDFGTRCRVLHRIAVCDEQMSIERCVEAGVGYVDGEKLAIGLHTVTVVLRRSSCRYAVPAGRRGWKRGAKADSSWRLRTGTGTEGAVAAEAGTCRHHGFAAQARFLWSSLTVYLRGPWL